MHCIPVRSCPAFARSLETITSAATRLPAYMPASYFAQVACAGFYRRERWEGPLASALLLLRECHQHTHDLAVRGTVILCICICLSFDCGLWLSFPVLRAPACATPVSPPPNSATHLRPPNLSFCPHPVTATGAR